MKRLFAILTVMAISLVAWGQELTVKDFHIDPSDISAVRYEVKDLNGEMCALVKIGLVLQDVTFEGSVVKSEFKDGEWWVYMVDKSWWLNIKTMKYLPLRYEFSGAATEKIYLHNAGGDSSGGLYRSYRKNAIREQCT